jgi:hypothetical protein
VFFEVFVKCWNVVFVSFMAVCVLSDEHMAAGLHWLIRAGTLDHSFGGAG